MTRYARIACSQNLRRWQKGRFESSAFLRTGESAGAHY
jgi:hypothetical protein